MNESKEEALFRKDLTDEIRKSNEAFAKSLNSSSMSTVAQSLARSFEFMSQMMLTNKYTIHQIFQLIKTILGHKIHQVQVPW